MEWENILTKNESYGIMKILINKPDTMNAMSSRTSEEICNALKVAEEDKEIKVIIISGVGRAFCAGGNIADMPKEPTPDYIHEWLKGSRDMVMQAMSMAKPIICAVNGYALGAGFSLALLGDIIIASDKAKFGAVFVKVALTPDAGMSYLLPRAVGIYKAKELVLTGDIIDAKEAERIGLVSRVVSIDKFEGVVNNLAQKLAKGPTWSMGLSKKNLNKSFEVSLFNALEAEIGTQAHVMQSADFKEGVSAFLEKREASFKGR